ncbi:hypothetical protein [Sphingopyxis sp. NFH-91]|uniref:hypothetical protein n=1 Tax=Sphingopyxis sp. NFH-91 TaxID=2744457 RepID=UPI001F319131|nr:hypothetical protein [Sphingopyxis sp. NFH-91]
MFRRDRRYRSSRILQDQLPRRVRFRDKLDQFLVSRSWRNGGRRWRQDQPQRMSAPYLDDWAMQDGLFEGAFFTRHCPPSAPMAQI